MEQMRQNEAGALTAQAIPQKDVEQACFHALGLIGRNCEYLDQHLAHVGADQQTRQAVNDISAASARLDRTVNEVMSLLDFLRTEEDPRLYPLDLCQLLQQVAAQADMVQAQLGVELTLDYGGWTACRVMADRNDAELLCLRVERAPEKGTQAVVTIPLCTDRITEPTVELHTGGDTAQAQQHQYQLRNMLVRELRTMPERGDPDEL